MDRSPPRPVTRRSEDRPRQGYCRVCSTSSLKRTFSGSQGCQAPTCVGAYPDGAAVTADTSGTTSSRRTQLFTCQRSAVPPPVAALATHPASQADLLGAVHSRYFRPPVKAGRCSFSTYRRRDPDQTRSALPFYPRPAGRTRQKQGSAGVCSLTGNRPSDGSQPEYAASRPECAGSTRRSRSAGL